MKRSPDSRSSDEDLIAACRAGDGHAWEALIEKYQRMVYAVPLRYRLPAEEVADVFQGVWIDLHRDLARLERPGSLRSWLMTAASRRSLLHKRRLKRHLPLADAALDEAGIEPPQAAMHEEEEAAQVLRQAVAALPPRCRQLVEMLFFEQPPVPYQEAARRLGLAIGSIGFIRGRCLAKLKKLLAQEDTGARS